MDFKEYLMEAYRKKSVDGESRALYSTGKSTTIIINPQYHDLTTYQYDKNAKRKKPRKKVLNESFDVFKFMINKIASNIVDNNPKSDKHDIKVELQQLPTNEIVQQYNKL